MLPDTSCIHLYIYPLSPSTCILYRRQNCRWRNITATCKHLYPDTSCSSGILVSGYMYPGVNAALGRSSIWLLQLGSWLRCWSYDVASHPSSADRADSLRYRSDSRATRMCRHYTAAAEWDGRVDGSPGRSPTGQHGRRSPVVNSLRKFVVYVSATRSRSECKSTHQHSAAAFSCLPFGVFVVKLLPVFADRIMILSKYSRNPVIIIIIIIIIMFFIFKSWLTQLNNAD